MPTNLALRGALAVAIVLLAACGTSSPTPPTSPSTFTSPAPEASSGPGAALPLPSPIGESSFAQQPDGTFLLTPVSARVLPGVLYAYVAFTHCGFTPTTFDFDGSFWTVVNPIGAEGNPPPGIGNPEDAGTIALVGPNEAVFTSGSGLLVALRRVDGPQVGFPCD